LRPIADSAIAQRVNQKMKRINLILLIIALLIAVGAAAPSLNPSLAERANQCSYCMSNCAACKKKRDSSEEPELSSASLLEKRQVDLAHWVRVFY